MFSSKLKELKSHKLTTMDLHNPHIFTQKLIFAFKCKYLAASVYFGNNKNKTNIKLMVEVKINVPCKYFACARNIHT